MGVASCRALYSPLVESFKSVHPSSHQLLEAATREDSMLESAVSTSLAPLPDTFLMEQTTTRAAPNDEEEGGRQQQCPSSHLLTDKKKQDITPMPQDPVASSSGDYDSGSNFSGLWYWQIPSWSPLIFLLSFGFLLFPLALDFSFPGCSASLSLRKRVSQWVFSEFSLVGLWCNHLSFKC